MNKPNQIKGKGYRNKLSQFSRCLDEFLFEANQGSATQTTLPMMSDCAVTAAGDEVISFDFLGDQMEAVTGEKLDVKPSYTQAIKNRQKVVAFLTKTYDFEVEKADLMIDVRFTAKPTEATFYSKKLNAWMAVLETRVAITFDRP